MSVNLSQSNAVIVLAVPATAVGYNISPNDSGKTFVVSCAVAGTMSLPLPIAGLNYKIVCLGALAASIIVLSASANITIRGVANTSTTAFAPANGITGRTAINIITAAAVLGDMLELFADGTNWFCRAQMSVVTAFTTT